MRGTDPKLAPGWRASQVLLCLENGQKDQVIEFLDKRHKIRFFKPIERLLKLPRSHPKGYGFGYGFAVMALCSLLIETIQSYWDGLPSTNRYELQKLTAQIVPVEYSVPPKPEWPKNNADVFKRFFTNRLFTDLFAGVDPDEFCTNIRNGLLHQAQTKGGWLLEQSGPVWDNQNGVINRTKFAKAVEASFDRYVDTLRIENWEADRWRKARRKVWWLVELSKGSNMQAHT